MIANVQPIESSYVRVEESTHFIPFTSKEKADVKAKEINGIVLKEEGKEIYRVFKTVPTRTIGYMEESP